MKAMELCGSQGGDTGEFDVMIGDCGEIKGRRPSNATFQFYFIFVTRK